MPQLLERVYKYFCRVMEMAAALLEDNWGCPSLDSSLENVHVLSLERHFAGKVANVCLSELELCLGEEKRVCMHAFVSRWLESL